MRKHVFKTFRLCPKVFLGRMLIGRRYIYFQRRRLIKGGTRICLRRISLGLAFRLLTGPLRFGRSIRRNVNNLRSLWPFNPGSALRLWEVVRKVFGFQPCAGGSLEYLCIPSIR